MVTTAFGKAELAEEVTLKQRANGKQFETLVQLLEDEKGNLLVRFAYATDGVARRGPVTLRRADLERLRTALKKTPKLAAVLDLAGGGGSRSEISTFLPLFAAASGRTTSTYSATSKYVTLDFVRFEPRD